MVRATKGFRHSTRRKLKKCVREKFKPEDYVKVFKPGEQVLVKIEPASDKGVPHPMFKSLVGTIKERRGHAYLVEIGARKKIKMITVCSEHLKPLR